MARIRHIAISTQDPEATANFYIEGLGLERVLFGLIGSGSFLSGDFGLPETDPDANDQRERHSHPCVTKNLVSTPRLLEFVAGGRGTGNHRLVLQVPHEIGGQPVGCFVTPSPVLL